MSGMGEWRFYSRSDHIHGEDIPVWFIVLEETGAPRGNHQVYLLTDTFYESESSCWSSRGRAWGRPGGWGGGSGS